MGVATISFEAGSFVVTDAEELKTRFPIADMIRATDVPDLLIANLTLLTKLADQVSTLMETLIEQGVIDQNFSQGFDFRNQAKDLVSTFNSQILK